MTTARIEEPEERIGELEDKIMEKEEGEKKREKKIHEGKIRELSNAMKQNNIHIIGILKRKRERKGLKVYLNKS